MAAKANNGMYFINCPSHLTRLGGRTGMAQAGAYPPGPHANPAPCRSGRHYAMITTMKTGRSPGRLRILVMMPTINHPERLKLEGLFTYARDKSGATWQIELMLPGLGDSRRISDFDGVVAYVTGEAMRRRVVGAGVPSVLIEDVCTPRRCPTARHVVTLLCDHEAEGEAAAGYFLERHFRNFAYLGIDEPWSRRRRQGFASTVLKAGCACQSFSGEGADALQSWLKRLPKPCALLAAHDFRARQALDAALSAGIAVPDDLAILGVDDDTIVCTTSAPAISSISTRDRELGYAAGRVLNELLLRRSVGGRVIRIRHTHVTSRASTNIDAVADPFVARTLAWVRAHLDGDLGAATLARRVGCSKHTLQIRVERAIGKPLGEFVRTVRTGEAVARLRHTDAPVTQIAAECGFASASHLSRNVRQAFGVNPLAIRKGKSAARARK